MSTTLQFEEGMVKRMEEINKADIGQPESEAYRMADAALQEMLATTALQKAVSAVQKTRILVTAAVGATTLRILSALHPNFEFVTCALGKPVGAEVEAMRDAVVCALTEKLYIEGEMMIHVGGSDVQHVPYGRNVHCEFPAYTVSVLAAKERRRKELLALYKEIAKVNEAMGGECLTFAALHRSLCKGSCTPSLCAQFAPAMLFDLLAVPMSQTQVCAALVMHDADVAEIMLPVEVQSLGGAAGVIPGTEVRAVYDPATDLINYDVAMGSVEFPPTPRSIVIEFLHRSAVQHAGSTFKFEIQEEYGFFRRITVTRVRALVDLDVTHSVWTPDGEDFIRVTVPKIKKLGLDPSRSENFYEASVLVKKSLFNSAFTYALSLERKVMSINLIRTKIASINDRVVVKGTSVELHERLDQSVLDVVSLGVFLIAYEDRFRAAEGFRIGSEQVHTMRTVGRGGFILDAARCCMGYAADSVRAALDHTVEPVLEKLDRAYTRSKRMMSATVRSDVLRSDFRSIVFKGVREPESWVAVVFSDHGPGALLSKIWSRVKLVSLCEPRALEQSSMDWYGDAFLDFESGIEPSFGSCAYEAEVLDPMDSLEYGNTYEAEHLVEAAKVTMAHTDAGPDDAGDLRYDRVRTTDACYRIPCQLKGLSGCIASPTDVVNETYTKIFPAVAQADMSRDLELFEEANTDFALNCYYMRLPADVQSSVLGPRYMSRLVGPNRPNAKPTTKNMLAALIKRNADANVLKVAEDADLSHKVWEKFKREYCREDIDDHLRRLRKQPIREAFPLFMNWLNTADGRKISGAMKTMLEEDDQLRDLPLNEFVAMFKGQVKPTLSGSAHAAYAKFQTIVYYDDKRINVFWSAIMRDVAARFESCLAPQVYVALRGDRKLREDHLSQYWPYGSEDMAFIQVDISEYDKSQESRTRHLEDLIFRELGMLDDYIDLWSYSHIDTTIRVLGMGIKMVVAYQRKSGDATTALGNVMLNMMASAYVFGKPTVSISQGDDGLIIRPCGGLDLSNVAAIYGQLFNLPVKLIVQTTTISSIPYAMSCFYVPDVEAKRVYVVPDPVRSVESHSKALTQDEDKFQEKWVSYQDRVQMWRAPYPMRDFTRMFQSWYDCPNVDVERFMLAKVSLGNDAKTYRDIWEEDARMR
uniref:Putative RdRp n=1 Tax=Uromyces virgavirus F TaxID=2592728 RepID=A0A7G3W8U8_9VIRU|nr:putative RdRp [Uromyces virgavirus F]